MELLEADPVWLQTQWCITKFAHPAGAPFAKFVNTPSLGQTLGSWISTACGVRLVVGDWWDGTRASPSLLWRDEVTMAGTTAGWLLIRRENTDGGKLEKLSSPTLKIICSVA
ncbi:hypothetical protein ILYODFUR_010123 [Ilyodon furcidens]|uniref:Uncharacterized protein n=1 Tax=Ilyodon furcidens TaxID=33524 RepID=A0ABV0V1U5_9TELE